MEKQSFWDRYARRYSHFVRADQEAYAQMLEWIRPAVRDRTVLELATGTGVIAHGIVHEAASIEATDASAGMIDVARSHSHSRKLHFSVQDMRYLPYADGSFEVVIAANVLHLLPEPDKALDEAARVLAPGGLLIVPTFTHAGGGQACKAAPLADAPCRVPAALEVVACGVSAVPAQTRLEGRAAPCAAGHVPADVCRLRAPLCGCGV